MSLSVAVVSSDKYEQVLATIGGTSMYGRMELMTYRDARFIVKGMGSDEITQAEYNEILAQFERDHSLGVQFSGDGFTYTLYYHSEHEWYIQKLLERLNSLGVYFNV